MAFHVVTKRCFLACEKVTSVIIEELIPDKPRPRPRRKKKNITPGKTVKALKTPPKLFSITISYYPIANIKNSAYSSGNGNSTEEYSLDLKIVGKKEAHLLYAEIIREVQEQNPGEGYLDKLVHKMLEDIDFKVLTSEENVEEDEY